MKTGNSQRNLQNAEMRLKFGCGYPGIFLYLMNCQLILLFFPE